MSRPVALSVAIPAGLQDDVVNPEAGMSSRSAIGFCLIPCMKELVGRCMPTGDGKHLRPAAITILWAPHEGSASTGVDEPGFHVEPRGERAARTPVPRSGRSGILRPIPASPRSAQPPRGETDAARGALERAERS